MNREVSGMNGQFVTTWGSDLEPGTTRIIPGSDKPLTTVVTCRCGHSAKFAGWSVDVDKKTSFRIYFKTSRRWAENEYFCSRECWVKYEPKQPVMQVSKLLASIGSLQDEIATIRSTKGYEPE